MRCSWNIRMIYVPVTDESRDLIRSVFRYIGLPEEERGLPFDKHERKYPGPDSSKMLEPYQEMTSSGKDKYICGCLRDLSRYDNDSRNYFGINVKPIKSPRGGFLRITVKDIARLINAISPGTPIYSYWMHGRSCPAQTEAKVDEYYYDTANGTLTTRNHDSGPDISARLSRLTLPWMKHVEALLEKSTEDGNTRLTAILLELIDRINRINAEKLEAERLRAEERKEAARRIAEASEALKEARRREAEKHLGFGTYPRTANGTDKSPIEWMLLEKQGDKALLISRNGLDAQPYDRSGKGADWENSSLRAWLNGEFLYRAFSRDERANIIPTEQGRVFLLSAGEAEKYLSVKYLTEDGARENTAARAALTGYARERGTAVIDGYKTEDGKASGWWWLRSADNTKAECVSADGSRFSHKVTDRFVSVRPAIWVKADSGLFAADSPEEPCEYIQKGA